MPVDIPVLNPSLMSLYLNFAVHVLWQKRVHEKQHRLHVPACICQQAGGDRLNRGQNQNVVFLRI